MKKAAAKQFVVGDVNKGADFSEEYIQRVIFQIASWYQNPSCDRRFADPEAAAKATIQQCLLAETKEGKPWQNAPKDFEVRVKVKAAYDLAAGKGIPISASKHPMAVRQLNDEAKKGAKRVSSLVATLADFDLQEFRDREEAAILLQHPELDNSVHRPHVKRLSLLYAQQEMIDKELMLQPSSTRRQEIMKEMKALTESINSMLITLDIHPDSLRKRIKESSEGSLGDLVAILDADDEFPARQKRWLLELLLQLWYKCNHPNGEGTGPQMSEMELWHETRTLPFSFTCLNCQTHYPHIVQGLTPKQIRDFLVSQGVLVELSVIPQLIKSEDLKGLNEFVDSIPEMVLPE